VAKASLFWSAGCCPTQVGGFPSLHSYAALACSSSGEIPKENQKKPELLGLPGMGKVNPEWQWYHSIMVLPHG
jgi:hypothetical protein